MEMKLRAKQARIDAQEQQAAKARADLQTLRERGNLNDDGLNVRESERLRDLENDYHARLNAQALAYKAQMDHDFAVQLEQQVQE